MLGQKLLLAQLETCGEAYAMLMRGDAPKPEWTDRLLRRLGRSYVIFSETADLPEEIFTDRERRLRPLLEIQSRLAHLPEMPIQTSLSLSAARAQFYSALNPVAAFRSVNPLPMLEKHPWTVEALSEAIKAIVSDGLRTSANSPDVARQVSELAYKCDFGLLGGWQVHGITSLLDGVPCSFSVSSNNLNAGSYRRPNRICDGMLPREQRSVERYFDTGCFVPPLIYTYGNAGRSILSAPGVVNFDVAVVRAFRLRESSTLSVRAEAFKLSNTPHFHAPNASVGTPDLGKISGTRADARHMQFEMRLAF